MKRILLLICLLCSINVQAQYTQHIQDVGDTRTWYQQKGMVQFLKDVYLKQFATADTCLCLAVNDSGKIVLRNRCLTGAGSGDVTLLQLADSLQKYLPLKDSNIAYTTIKRLRDSIATLEARINAKGYLTAEVDGSITNELQSLSLPDNGHIAISGGNSLPVPWLSSYTETDPNVPAWVKAITNIQITHWDAAYSWGDHAAAGYALNSKVTADSLKDADSLKVHRIDIDEKVPQTRTINVNGSQADLSADVNLTVGYVPYSGHSDNSDALQGHDGAYYIDRANHTGTQAISTVTGLQDSLSDLKHKEDTVNYDGYVTKNKHQKDSNSLAALANVIPTLQQVTTSGNVTTDNVSISTNYIQYPSYLFISGNSFTATTVYNTSVDSGWAQRTFAKVGIAGKISGVGGSGIQYSVANALKQINPGHSTWYIVEHGVNNEHQATTIALKMSTYKLLMAGWNDIMANHYLGLYYDGGGANVTRSGSWITGFNSQTKWGGKSINAAVSTTANDTLKRMFTDSTVVIGLGGADGTLSTYSNNVRFYVDGVLKQTLNLNGWQNGVTDIVWDGKNIEVTAVIKGLGYGLHELWVINNDNDTACVDYVGHLGNVSNPLTFMKLTYSYYGSSGYTDSLNNMLDSLIATYGRPGLSAANPNLYFNAFDIRQSPEMLHPNDSGMRNYAKSIDLTAPYVPKAAFRVQVPTNGNQYLLNLANSNGSVFTIDKSGNITGNKITLVNPTYIPTPDTLVTRSNGEAGASQLDTIAMRRGGNKMSGGTASNVLLGNASGGGISFLFGTGILARLYNNGTFRIGGVDSKPDNLMKLYVENNGTIRDTLFTTLVMFNKAWQQYVTTNGGVTGWTFQNFAANGLSYDFQFSGTSYFKIDFTKGLYARKIPTNSSGHAGYLVWGTDTIIQKVTTIPQADVTGLTASLNAKQDSTTVSNDSLYEWKGGVKKFRYKYVAGVGGSAAWGGITGTLSSQTDLQTALDAKVTANGAITGAIKTKITYDAKGLVTAGADATTADIAASTNKNYVTDAQQVVIGNTSGTNTGDQTITLTGDVTGTGTGSLATAIGAGKVTNTMLAGSIAAAKLVGTDIATVGTVTTGTWQGTLLNPTYGGTGVNNGSKTTTLGGNFTTAGAFNTTLTVTATTALTLPTTGTLATLAGTETLTNKRITKRIGTTASSSTPTPDADNNDVYTVTALAAAAAFGAPTGTPTDGQGLIIRIKDNGTARALSFNAAYRFSTDITAPTTTTISKTMYLGLIWNAADSKWDCVAKIDNF